MAQRATAASHEPQRGASSDAEKTYTVYFGRVEYSVRPDDLERYNKKNDEEGFSHNNFVRDDEEVDPTRFKMTEQVFQNAHDWLGEYGTIL